MANSQKQGVFRSAARVCLTALLPICLAATAWAQDVAPKTFGSAADAAKAFAAAAKDGSTTALIELFGSEAEDILFSGDSQLDEIGLQKLSKVVREKVGLDAADTTAVVLVGVGNWPLPIPLALRDGKWAFDTAAGREEVLNRRIGKNELNAIKLCRAFVAAQKEYFSEDRDGDEVAEYAQRMVSTPNTRDGLFWPVDESESPSPLGPIAAEARAEGYEKKGDGPQPYQGYYFRILPTQGASAPGGKHGYVINGNMIAGFALVAYPAEFGNSGVMTFIVNQQGKVYEKSLGEKTAKLAAAMTEYNPDSTWTAVK
jgi:hypothetical protein